MGEMTKDEINVTLFDEVARLRAELHSRMEIKNAIITSVKIENERGLSAWLQLDYGDSGQGFGGWMLKGGNANYGGHFIARCLDIGGVDEWSKLVGKSIRVRIEDGLVKAIGHIIKDDWFCPKEEFASLAASH